jgi:hypothetical protein
MEMTPTEKINLLVAFIALLISIIALVYTVLTYTLKRGHRFKCSFSTCSSLDCDDEYVSSLTIVNQKDRPAVIFEIYLQLGYGNFLLLDDFSNKPLILHGFEVYYKKYDPLIFYQVGIKRIKIDSLLGNPKIRTRLVVSTAEGKKVVKIGMKHWRPQYSFFENYLTAIIRPQYLTYEDIRYGSNVKYLLVIHEAGEKQVIPIKDGDEQLQCFEKLKLDKNVLLSRDVFQLHLQRLIDKGQLKFDTFEVVDFQEDVQGEMSRFDSEVYQANPHSFFYYNIFGRVATYFENLRIRKENKKNFKN